MEHSLLDTIELVEKYRLVLFNTPWDLETDTSCVLKMQFGRSPAETCISKPTQQKADVAARPPHAIRGAISFRHASSLHKSCHVA